MILDDRIFRPASRPALDPVRVTLVAAAGAEPWLNSDAELLGHLRLDDADTDATYLTAIIKAARLHFERLTGLSLVNQTFKATWDRLPPGNAIDLPRAPLASITSVKYLDTSGAEQTFSAAAYSAKDVACAGAFGRLALKPDYDWPDLGDYRGAFYVTYVAGFGAAATDIPADLRLAVLWLVAWWYESRLPVNVGNITSELPHHLAAIIESHRVAFIG